MTDTTSARRPAESRDGGNGASPGDITVSFKSPNWPIKDLVADYDPARTILEVKSDIRRRVAGQDGDLPESAQRLIFGGQVLQDDRTLGELGLPNVATVHLVASTTPTPRAASVDLTAAPATQSSSTPPPLATDDQPTPTVAETSGLDRADVTKSSDAAEPARSPSRAAATQTEQSTSSPAATEAYPTDGIVYLGLTYDVQLINGYPYLVQRAQRSSRSARTDAAVRSARGQTPRDSRGVVMASQDSIRTRHLTANGAADHVRRGQIELPASSAFRVRAANGQRAVVLSPDAVRQLQNSGMRIDDTLVQPDGGGRGINPRLARFVIDPQRVAEFFRTAMPHGMLLVKLFVLVALLGTNATWSRLVGLITAAFIIFMWQSGLVARALAEIASRRNLARAARQPLGAAAGAAGASAGQVPGGQHQPHQPQHFPRNDAASAQAQHRHQSDQATSSSTQANSTAASHRTTATASEVTSTASHARSVQAPQAPSLIATVATAFVSSLLPGMESALAAGGAPAEVAPVAERLPAVEAAAQHDEAGGGAAFLTDADTAPGGSESAAAAADASAVDAGDAAAHEADVAVAGDDGLTDADVGPGGSEHSE